MMINYFTKNRPSDCIKLILMIVLKQTIINMLKYLPRKQYMADRIHQLKHIIRN